VINIVFSVPTRLESMSCGPLARTFSTLLGSAKLTNPNPLKQSSAPPYNNGISSSRGL